MTREEITNSRPRAFSKWIRENLPDSYTGFRVTDIDWVIMNVNTRKFILIEEKTRNGEIKGWQREILNILHKIILSGIEAYNINYDDKLEYFGVHLIQFENTNPDDGEILFDHKHITKECLKNMLSLGD